MSALPDDAEFATRAVHAGLDPDPSFGSVVPPIHQTSTYVQPTPGQFVEDFDYARSANPTRSALERALGELEGGLASCFSSGMAATHALLSAHCRSGDHVILPSDLYGFGVSAISGLQGHFAQNWRKLSQYYEALDAGHPGLLAMGLTPPDPDGLWRFPAYSYGRAANPTCTITPPTEVLINGVRCVNLDGSLFADAALAVLNSKPFGRSK